MRRAKGSRRWLPPVVFGLTAILCGGTTWLWIERDLPPNRALLDARMSLNQARSASDEVPSRPLLDSAEQNLVDAQRAMEQEYRKLEIFRNYDLPRYHVDRARKLVSEAEMVAQEARQSAAIDGARRLTLLRRSSATTRRLVERLNLRGDALVRLSSADAFIKAADARLMDQEAIDARDLLDRAEAEIEEASVALQARLTRFLERRHEWNVLVRETLAASARTNEPMVLIDKLNHECHILRRGRVVETFAVEMGNSWMERKLTEGDRATPEGRYQISVLKGNGNSRFYKAALLSYPNPADRSRFVRAKRAGQISSGARIGGLIEIHGEGGRGNNWTAGCVSLTNARHGPADVVSSPGHAGDDRGGLAGSHVAVFGRPVHGRRGAEPGRLDGAVAGSDPGRRGRERGRDGQQGTPVGLARVPVFSSSPQDSSRIGGSAHPWSDARARLISWPRFAGSASRGGSRPRRGTDRDCAGCRAPPCVCVVCEAPCSPVAPARARRLAKFVWRLSTWFRGGASRCAGA